MRIDLFTGRSGKFVGQLPAFVSRVLPNPETRGATLIFVGFESPSRVVIRVGRQEIDELIEELERVRAIQAQIDARGGDPYGEA